MAWITLYPGIMNSPIATLTSPIDGDDTTLPVDHTDYFTTGPGIAVLFDENGNTETVSFTDKSASSGAGNLQTCTRGIQGTARPWGTGSYIARLFTALDFDSIRENLEFFKDAINSPGSSGTVLTSRGTGSTPTFQDLPTGGSIVDWSGDITFTRASNTTFTVTDNATNQAIFIAGRPIRYSDDGSSWAYGIVVSYASGTVTLAGAAMTTSYDAHLQYASMSRVVQIPLLIPGYYEDASDTTLLANDLGHTIPWGQGTAYLVKIAAKSRVTDGSSDGKVNVRINGSNVCTSNSNAGLLLNSTNWITTTDDISMSYYDINWLEEIEVNATKGTVGDAQDLSLILVFVVG